MRYAATSAKALLTVVLLVSLSYMCSIIRMNLSEEEFDMMMRDMVKRDSVLCSMCLMPGL